MEIGELLNETRRPRSLAMETLAFWPAFVLSFFDLILLSVSNYSSKNLKSMPVCRVGSGRVLSVGSYLSGRRVYIFYSKYIFDLIILKKLYISHVHDVDKALPFLY